jgi:acetyl/propionyl-CoA carboxylase alpha subunit
VRIDSGVREGDEISMFYDPMIAKLDDLGKDRDAALDVHGEALDRFHIEGIQDNIPFIAAVMDEKRFRSGNITTAYIKDEFPRGLPGHRATATQEAQLICSAAYVHAFFERRAGQVSGTLAARRPSRAATGSSSSATSTTPSRSISATGDAADCRGRRKAAQPRHVLEAGRASRRRRAGRQAVCREVCGPHGRLPLPPAAA